MLQSVAIVLAVAIVFLDVNALAPLFESGPVSARPTYAEFCVPGLVEKGHYEAEIRISIHNQSDEPVTFDRWSARIDKGESKNLAIRGLMSGGLGAGEKKLLTLKYESFPVRQAIFLELFRANFGDGFRVQGPLRVSVPGIPREQWNSIVGVRRCWEIIVE